MIDWHRVAELRDEIGADDFGEVVELFLDEVGGAIDLLPESKDSAPHTEEQMHFLKGAAMNLGFAELSELCHKGEDAARSGNANAVKSSDIAACYENSKAAFLSGYEARFAA